MRMDQLRESSHNEMGSKAMEGLIKLEALKESHIQKKAKILAVAKDLQERITAEEAKLKEIKSFKP